MNRKTLARKAIASLFMSMLCLLSYAQTRQVTGLVTDANGEPMIGVNVTVVGTTNGTKMNATLPLITDDGIINLKKARHPLLDKKKAVPINLSLGSEYQALIITGPNTGGKTVALKTAGLLSVMTMCGLLIPAADGSSISIFENILVDIGDSQSKIGRAHV